MHFTYQRTNPAPQFDNKITFFVLSILDSILIRGGHPILQVVDRGDCKHIIIILPMDSLRHHQRYGQIASVYLILI